MKRRSSKINFGLKFILITVIIFGAAVLQGCAVFSKKATSPESSIEVPKNEPQASVAPGTVDYVSDATLKREPEDSTAPLIFGRGDIDSFKVIEIRMVFADVAVSTITLKKGKKGSLHVHLIKGDASRCKIKVAEHSETELRITDSAVENGAPLSAVNKNQKSWVPSDSDCRYGVELVARESAKLNIETLRGSVLVENWSAPVSIKMEWGDIDVGNVDALSVQCTHCMLSGDGIAGKLEYTMESGNVGVAGLTGTVNGVTLGDTVLKWQKITSNSAVKLVSRAGDVLLSFPGGVPLAMNVRAPKGDVYTNDMDKNSGVPVSVTAELGNIRLYRNAKQ